MQRPGGGRCRCARGVEILLGSICVKIELRFFQVKLQATQYLQRESLKAPKHLCKDYTSFSIARMQYTSQSIAKEADGAGVLGC